jgi:hypothetical protein
MQVVPKNFLSHLFRTLKDNLKPKEGEETAEREFVLRQGMVEGISLIESRISRWFAHQKNLARLAVSGKRLLVTKNVTLSEGRYRKFEWYEGTKFYSLALRWGRDQTAPEIALQVQNTANLDNEYLIYQGTDGYDDLKKASRVRGVRGIRASKTDPLWTEVD